MGSYKKIGLSHEMGLIDTPPFKKMSKLYHVIEFQDYRANRVDLAEVAHYEPPHQDLHCL